LPSRKKNCLGGKSKTKAEIRRKGGKKGRYVFREKRVGKGDHGDPKRGGRVLAGERREERTSPWCGRGEKKGLNNPQEMEIVTWERKGNVRNTEGGGEGPAVPKERKETLRQKKKAGPTRGEGSGKLPEKKGLQGGDLFVE